MAVLIHNTSYLTSIGYEPSRVFDGRIRYIILDLKLGLLPQQLCFPISQFSQDVIDETELIYEDVRKKAIRAYIK